MPPPLPQSDLNAILHATAPLWPELRNQRLFLTGGTGFFGAWLVESFLHINQVLDLNASVTILTRSPAAFLTKLPHLRNHPSLTLFEGDVRTFQFPSGSYEFIIHAATEASAKQLAEAPEEMRSTILAGTEHVLDFAAHANTHKLLYTSSGAVYGHQTDPLQPEDARLEPTTIYGQSKLAAEHLLTQAPCEAKIARCFAFLGPHLPLDTHFAAGNFLADALHSRPIHIVSDGRALRSYLYPTDLAIWLWTILFRAPSLRPYNVGSQDPVSIRELAETIRAEVNPTIEIHIAQPPRADPAHRYVPSTTRAQTELALTQTVSLAEAIRRTAAWHRLK
jgi:nucleoside-diphosphate-sugar epimerase